MKYRTPDGSCNNLRNPMWGMAFSPFERLMYPEYDDGVNEPKTKGASGRPLPNPRVVSTSVVLNQDSPSRGYSLLLMQYGQFLDHDMTLTTLAIGKYSLYYLLEFVTLTGRCVISPQLKMVTASNVAAPNSNAIPV